MELSLSRHYGSNHDPLPQSPASPRTCASQEIRKSRVCDHCRVKKIKCDMGIPSCTACRLRQYPCAYSQRKKKPGPPKRGSLAKGSAQTRLTTERPTTSTDSNTPRHSLFDTDLPIFDLIDPTPMMDLLPQNDWGSLWNDFADSPSTSQRSQIEALSPPSGLQISPNLEDYLFDLYLQHIQPIYPLFRKATLSGLSTLPKRLKFAICAVSSRFAVPERLEGLSLTPSAFAKSAQALDGDEGDAISIDELKAFFLLCLYNVAESTSWGSIADVAKLSRMLELYQSLRVEDEHELRNDEGMHGDDAEEWRNLWWSIYVLDTECSAVASGSHAIAAHLPACIELPTKPISEFTNSPPAQIASSDTHDPLFVTEHKSKHWETMRTIFQKSSCRNRNLYIGVSSLMRSVTELRQRVRYMPTQTLKTQMQELESDSVSMSFAIPSWWSDPSRNFAFGETKDEHCHRLNSLLVWCCSKLLLKITAARLDFCGRTGFEYGFGSTQWQPILSEAYETIAIIQCWKSPYVQIADPMCCHIVYLAAAVLIMDSKSQVGSPNRSCEGSQHIDLLLTFLEQMGRYWPIGRQHLNLLKDLQTLPSEQTLHGAYQVIFRLTSPMGFGSPFQGRTQKLAIEKAQTPAAHPALDFGTGGLEAYFGDGIEQIDSLDGMPFPWTSGRPDTGNNLEATVTLRDM